MHGDGGTAKSHLRPKTVRTRNSGNQESSCLSCYRATHPDKFHDTTGSLGPASLTRLSGDSVSHQLTTFVRSDSGRALDR